MASPILISNPSNSVSVLAIVRGIQLSLLGAYRSLQNVHIYNTEMCLLALRMIQISIIIQLILWIPTYLCRLASFVLGRFFGWNVEIDIDYLIRLLNLNYVMIASVKYFEPGLDNIFLTTLLFVDSKSGEQYYQNLVKLPFESPYAQSYQRSFWDTVKFKYTHSLEFRKFVKTNTKHIITTIIIYIVCKRSYKLESLIIIILSFQNFDDKIGTVLSSFLVVILSIIPRYYSLQALSFFWGGCNLMQDLLSPYFNRISLNKLEKIQWIKSREGILLGFSFCYFLVMIKLPWIGLIIYGIGHASTAYLITKLSSPPPEKPKHLINWISTQLILNPDEQGRILEGNFVFDKGFAPFPGSFFIYPPTN